MKCHSASALSAAVAHHNHASAGLEAPAAVTPRAPQPGQQPAQQGFYPSPGQGSCMPGAWEQQAAAAAAAGQQGWGAAWGVDAPGAHAPGMPPGHGAAHLQPQQQQQQAYPVQLAAHGGAAAYGQAAGQATQWGPRYEPYAAMNDMVSCCSLGVAVGVLGC